MAKSPLSFFFGGKASSDKKKDLIFNLGGSFSTNSLGGNGYSISLKTEWEPNTQLTLSIEPEYYKDLEKTQWIGKPYVLAELGQKSFSTSIRINWSFTPTLSLQLYIQPLIELIFDIFVLC